jgi:hypothetical protein
MQFISAKDLEYANCVINAEHLRPYASDC